MPKLLVAGTGGISLKDNHGNNLGYPVAMQIGVLTGGLIGKSIQELKALLSMEHEPGQLKADRTSLEPGTSIEAGEVLMVAYNQLSGFEHFLYDWRADLRYNAKRLRGFLRKPTPGNEKWKLVGHSQGGLLIVLASKFMNNESEFAEYVDSAVLVGAPLAGSVNSAVALLNGDSFGASAAPVLKQIMRTWPSLYQMLPAWPIAMSGDGMAPSERQQMNTTGWTGHPGIRGDLLLRARETQKLLRDPLSHMEQVRRVTLLMARNRNTSIALKRIDSKLTSESAINVKGDGLVPYIQSISWIGQHIAQYVHSFGAGINEHRMLLSDPTVGSRLRVLLN